jgi:hypothetical protein
MSSVPERPEDERAPRKRPSLGDILDLDDPEVARLVSALIGVLRSLPEEIQRQARADSEAES